MCPESTELPVFLTPTSYIAWVDYIFSSDFIERNFVAPRRRVPA
jgi:hypothetical protein